ncbi:hypothetical protein RND71_023434 [Anisodus tanguticus]|uniref:Uncharacterized protein n=1 Tax=Anisodus tanguticus TaxID=243964 RepID=A0AAE1RSL0_9SOLA|nr:hypothetical protein RND71_023434 [Anisodus tanguticus]
MPMAARKFTMDHLAPIHWCAKDGTILTLKWSRLYRERSMSFLKNVFYLCESAKFALVAINLLKLISFLEPNKQLEVVTHVCKRSMSDKSLISVPYINHKLYILEVRNLESLEMLEVDVEAENSNVDIVEMSNTVLTKNLTLKFFGVVLKPTWSIHVAMSGSPTQACLPEGEIACAKASYGAFGPLIIYYNTKISYCLELIAEQRPEIVDKETGSFSRKVSSLLHSLLSMGVKDVEVELEEEVSETIYDNSGESVKGVVVEVEVSGQSSAISVLITSSEQILEANVEANDQINEKLERESGGKSYVGAETSNEINGHIINIFSFSPVKSIAYFTLTKRFTDASFVVSKRAAIDGRTAISDARTRNMISERILEEGVSRFDCFADDRNAAFPKEWGG